MTYDGSNFDEVIADHRLWVQSGHCSEYSSADFRFAILDGHSFKGLDLQGANFFGANLVNADFSRANLEYADLYEAKMRGANLTDANLVNASFYRADLSYANLSGANLCCTQFYRTNLQYADLTNAETDLFTHFVDACMFGAKGAINIPLACPDTGEFIGWKACVINRDATPAELLSEIGNTRCVIVKLKIPEDARRSSATGRKCRADKAVVTEIQSLNGTPLNGVIAFSMHDKNFIYKVGATVKPRGTFSENRFDECTSGIHFFVNRCDAVKYAD